jgi:hypothetical protein
MRSNYPTIRSVDHEDEEALGPTRHLFRSYAAESADSIAEALRQVRGLDYGG